VDGMSDYEEALFRYRTGLIGELCWQEHLKDEVFSAWLKLRADYGMEPPEQSLTLAKIVELYLPDLGEECHSGTSDTDGGSKGEPGSNVTCLASRR
jgi:hypothetical protein